MLGVAERTAKYLAEIAIHRKGVEYPTDDRQVASFLAGYRPLPTSAMGVLGTMFYDMAANGSGRPDERTLVRKTSSNLVLLLDLVDDVIDERQTSNAEKTKFVKNVRNALVKGKEYTSEDVEERSSYYLAHWLNQDLVKRDSAGRVDHAIDDLMDNVFAQLDETSYEKLMEIVNNIGMLCTELSEIPTEVIKDREYPEVRNAAKYMGKYLHLWDSLCDLDDDLRDGTHTYPAERVRREGDSRKLRSELKREIACFAEEAIRKGEEGLSEYQLPIYRSIKLLMDLKYQLISMSPLKSALVRGI